MSIKELTIAWRQKLPAVHKLILMYIADASAEHGMRVDRLSLADISQFAGTMPDEARAAITYLISTDHIRWWWPGGEPKVEYYQVQQPPR